MFAPIQEAIDGMVIGAVCVRVFGFDAVKEISPNPFCWSAGGDDDGVGLLP